MNGKFSYLVQTCKELFRGQIHTRRHRLGWYRRDGNTRPMVFGNEANCVSSRWVLYANLSNKISKRQAIYAQSRSRILYALYKNICLIIYFKKIHLFIIKSIKIKFLSLTERAKILHKIKFFKKTRNNYKYIYYPYLFKMDQQHQLIQIANSWTNLRYDPFTILILTNIFTDNTRKIKDTIKRMRGTSTRGIFDVRYNYENQKVYVLCQIKIAEKVEILIKDKKLVWIMADGGLSESAIVFVTKWFEEINPIARGFALKNFINTFLAQSKKKQPSYNGFVYQHKLYAENSKEINLLRYCVSVSFFVKNFYKKLKFSKNILNLFSIKSKIYKRRVKIFQKIFLINTTFIFNKIFLLKMSNLTAHLCKIP
ncbi:hypothetical protein EHP00_2340 [Ecytonucleospora hepatopenaei]|uniref:Uncharacterized protein n=1 Tax=Ecytonucleospora hepatopenaei TaxID=646526 RepID=A0A1W0E8C8_9MICR|nr:hypothetical protein EHP00_2340 [Ecytonucleospora hepatopenaei]